jgi:hypothetical protein
MVPGVPAPATRSRIGREAILFGVLLAAYVFLGWALIAGIADFAYLVVNQGAAFTVHVAR